MNEKLVKKNKFPVKGKTEKELIKQYKEEAQEMLDESERIARERAEKKFKELGISEDASPLEKFGALSIKDVTEKEKELRYKGLSLSGIEKIPDDKEILVSIGLYDDTGDFFVGKAGEIRNRIRNMEKEAPIGFGLRNFEIIEFLSDDPKAWLEHFQGQIKQYKDRIMAKIHGLDDDRTVWTWDKYRGIEETKVSAIKWTMDHLDIVSLLAHQHDGWRIISVKPHLELNDPEDQALRNRFDLNRLPLFNMLKDEKELIYSQLVKLKPDDIVRFHFSDEDSTDNITREQALVFITQFSIQEYEKRGLPKLKVVKRLKK